MSVQAMTWVFSHSEAGGTDRLVLLTMANYARPDGTRAYPSIATLAGDCRMSERQIIRILQRLVADGHLEVTGVSAKQTKLYRIVGMTAPDKTSGARPGRPAKLSGGGDRLTPPRGDRLSEGGDIQGSQGVTSGVKRGDTAMSPEPYESVDSIPPFGAVARPRARDDGPMTKVIDHLEERTGRPWSSRPGSKLWDTLAADLRDFGIDRVIAAMQAIDGDHPDHGQLVFGATRRLHPIDSTPSRSGSKPGGHTRDPQEVVNAFNRS